MESVRPSVESVRPAATHVTSTYIVLPPHTNVHGTAFGGQIAAWCDISAAVAAHRFCRRPVVTASMDQINFERPVKQGMVVVLEAQVNQAWSTSMEIGVVVQAEDPNTGIRMQVCTAFLTFVGLGEDGKPTAIPRLDTRGDPEAVRRQEEAEVRRRHRLASRC
jgi:acyl-CoA hydrolase